MKRVFIRWFGVGPYVRWVQPLSALYHSLFRSGDMREHGLRLACELLAEGDVVFDVGAHIGKFTSIAAKRVGREGRVVSFEPVGWSRAVLSRMVRLRGYQQVRVVPAGVSDRSGAGLMSVPLTRDGRPEYMLSHIAKVRSEGDRVWEEQVELITLDDYCEQHAIRHVDFIKCDTEGHEGEVFRGATRLLEGAHPTIYCEISANFAERAGQRPDELFLLLRQHGYQAYLADDTGQVFVPVAGFERDTDYLFIHENRIALTAKRIGLFTSREPSFA